MADLSSTSTGSLSEEIKSNICTTSADSSASSTCSTEIASPPVLDDISPESDGPLGTLRKLPAEIRAPIFRYVLDVNSATSDYMKGQPVRSDIVALPDRTSVLRTSREIHDEAIIELFRTNSFLIITECDHLKSGYKKNETTGDWEYTPLLYTVQLYVIKFGFFKNRQIAAKSDTYVPRTFRQQPLDRAQVPTHLLKSIRRICVFIGNGNDADGAYLDNLREMDPSATTREVQYPSDEGPKSLYEQAKSVIEFIESFEKVQVNLMVTIHLGDFPNGKSESTAFLEMICKFNNMKTPRILSRFEACQKDLEIHGVENGGGSYMLYLTTEFEEYLRGAAFMPLGAELEAFDGNYFTFVKPEYVLRSEMGAKEFEKHFARSTDDRFEDGSLNCRFGGRLA